MGKATTKDKATNNNSNNNNNTKFSNNSLPTTETIMEETTMETTTTNLKGQLEVEDVCFKKNKKQHHLSQSVILYLFNFSFFIYKLVTLEQKCSALMLSHI